MDWTAVFEESGDEEFISQQLYAISHGNAPRLARLVSKLYHHQHDDDDDDDDEEHAQHEEKTHPAREDEEVEDFSEHRLFQMSFRSSSDSLAALQLATSPSVVEETSSSSSAYTLQALYYLSINYILGVGCLGIPYAFARAGFVLCISILSIVTLFSYMTVMWVAETGERYHSYCQQQKQKEESSTNKQQEQSTTTTTTAQGIGGGGGNFSESSPLLATEAAKRQRIRRRGSDDTNNNNNNNNNHTTNHNHNSENWDRYEVVDLVGFYLGSGHQIIYQISLMALMYIGLLAYSQVFCSAISELVVPRGGVGSSSITLEGILPQLAFGIMVIPLSCIELDEQISVQSIMAAVRFLAIFIMVIGSLLALFLDDSNTTTTATTRATNFQQEQKHHPPPFWAPPDRDGCHMSYTFCFSSFGVAFSTSLFSQLFQHSIPGLLRPLRDQPSEHRKVPKTLGASLLTTLSFYLMLGTSAASFFGAGTRSSVNLNFANFTMGLDPQTAPFWLLAAVKTAASIVVIFPALDTISVFPLIANTLGNNLCSKAVGPSTIYWCARLLHKLRNNFFLWRWRWRWHYSTEAGSATTTTTTSATASGIEDRTAAGQRQRRNRISSFSELPQQERKDLIAKASRLTTIFWRLVASIPPLLGSLVAADLSFSLLLAGVAGVYIAFFAPSLMHLKSNLVQSLQSSSSSSTSSSQNITSTTTTVPSRTIFHGWYSSIWLSYPVLIFATFSLGAVLLQIKGAWVDMHT